jgi:hypothetical protein
MNRSRCYRSSMPKLVVPSVNIKLRNKNNTKYETCPKNTPHCQSGSYVEDMYRVLLQTAER